LLGVAGTAVLQILPKGLNTGNNRLSRWRAKTKSRIQLYKAYMLYFYPEGKYSTIKKNLQGFWVKILRDMVGFSII